MTQILQRSTFTEDFVRLNYPEKKNIFRWTFLPGMLFQDQVCWWKEGRRIRFHEGVDFCNFYGNEKLAIEKVKADLVPALFAGVVVGIEDDFLAETVWMQHASITRGNLMLFSSLAHVDTADGLRVGREISHGEVVARVGRHKNISPMDMHLHVTVFWAPHFLKTSRITWRQLPALKEIALVDPLQVIGRRP